MTSPPIAQFTLHVVPDVCVHALAGVTFEPQADGSWPLQHWLNAAWSGHVQNVELPLMSKQQVRLLELLLHPTARRARTTATRPI
jgi:hypothetical protein